MGKPITLDHIPPEHHQGIGLVSNAWAHLEGVVERIIWQLARLNDNRGASITTHIGIRARLEAALALANLEFPNATESKLLKKLCGTVINLYGERNEIVHSRTLHLPGETVRPIYKARGKLIKHAKPVDAAYYKPVADRILATASEMREVLARFNNLITQKD